MFLREKKYSYKSKKRTVNVFKLLNEKNKHEHQVINIGIISYMTAEHFLVYTLLGTMMIIIAPSRTI